MTAYTLGPRIRPSLYNPPTPKPCTRRALTSTTFTLPFPNLLAYFCSVLDYLALLVQCAGDCFGSITCSSQH